MKKIIISLTMIGAMFLFTISCEKKTEVVSKVQPASYPTITLLGSQFYSIPTNGTVPTVAASSYDSVLNEVCPFSLDASGIDVTTPGLYVVPIRSSNSNGYKSSTNVMIAVTDIPSAWNLSGEYKRTSNNALVNLAEIENGLYEVDNVGGAPTFPVVAYFVQIDDSTINLPLQFTSLAGDLECDFEILNAMPADTFYSWKVVNGFFGPAIRKFVKQ